MSENDNLQGHNGIIVRADAAGKILDFRDALVLARSEHYAMMHGRGGKKYAPVSVIEVTITDYGSAGEESKGTFVRAHMPPEVFAMLLEICKKNIGTVALPLNDGLWKQIQEANMVQRATLRGLISLANGIMLVCSNVVKGNASAQNEKSFFAEIGRSLKEAKKAFLPKDEENRSGNQNQDSSKSTLTVPSTVDYSYSQTRVNIYNKDEQGAVAVSTVSIVRSGYRPNGAVAKLPWTVKISNFRAMPKEHQNGTTSYISSTVKDLREAFIMVSDSDMFRCCYRVEHYIQVWENTECIPNVKAGLIAKRNARQNQMD